MIQFRENIAKRHNFGIFIKLIAPANGNRVQIRNGSINNRDGMIQRLGNMMRQIVSLALLWIETFLEFSNQLEYFFQVFFFAGG